MSLIFNTFNNSKNVFNMVNNLIYNIIMEYLNKMNEHILHKKQVMAQSSEKRILKNFEVGGEYYDDAQTENDDNEQKIGFFYYIFKDKIQILEFENEEFLKIVDKDFKKNENYSLINSIGRYVLKYNNSIMPEPSFYNYKLRVISFSLSPFVLPFLFPFMISTSIRFDNINIYLEIGEEYIYDDEDKETPNDIQIYQSFKVIISSFYESFAGIYLPFIVGNMHLDFGLKGLLSRSETNTNIKINILNNTYLIEFNGILSKEYNYFLRIGITIYILFIPFRNDFYIFNIIMIGLKYINNYVQKSFREPLLDNSPLEALSYFSYSNTSLEQIQKLKEQN